jgi:hypothetical protein
MPTNTYVALDTKSLSGVSSITFTSIPQGYTDLVIVINGVNTTGSYPANFRVGNGSVDTGSNYSRTGLSGNGSSATSYRGSNETYFYTDYASDISGGGMSITNIMNYSNTTTNKTFLNRCGGAGAAVRAIAGLWRSTAAISTVEVSFGITQTGGTATIYGIAATSVGAKATGGDIYSDSSYYYHVFDANGTFTPTQSISADVLVVAGGGGGGSGGGGGGGAGGLLGYTAQSLTATGYSITVGAGGEGGGASSSSPANGTVGSNSSAFSLTSIGGGSGGAPGTSGNGGSGIVIVRYLKA